MYIYSFSLTFIHFFSSWLFDQLMCFCSAFTDIITKTPCCFLLSAFQSGLIYKLFHAFCAHYKYVRPCINLWHYESSIFRCFIYVSWFLCYHSIDSCVFAVHSVIFIKLHAFHKISPDSQTSAKNRLLVPWYATCHSFWMCHSCSNAFHLFQSRLVYKLLHFKVNFFVCSYKCMWLSILICCNKCNILQLFIKSLLNF